MRIVLSVAALLVLAFLAGLLEWDPMQADSAIPAAARPGPQVPIGGDGGVVAGMPPKERVPMVFDQAETGGYVEALKILCEIPLPDNVVGVGLAGDAQPPERVPAL